LLQINVYVDDVVIISRNLKVLNKVLQELDKAAQELRLVINRYKRKYMRVSKKSHNQCKRIAARRYGLERVATFPYLGSTINEGKRIAK